MKNLCFIDTNIFVYSQDGRDSTKQQQAAALLRKLRIDGTGVISSQVIQEFCNVALKSDIQLPKHLLKDILESVLFPLLGHTPSIVFYENALDLQQTHQLSYYDALIVQAAIDLGCTTLYSEDLQHGQKYGGLTIQNPFM